MKSKAATRHTQLAIRRIELFERRYGKPHLYLAYHAAFPLALTPDLLYRLWANFQQDIHGHLLDIPWSAVADILLSNLCEEVGHELYEMDSAVREELLRRLKAEPKFSDATSGQDRIIQLSNFLLSYIEQHFHSDDSDAQAFAQAQQWLALAYTKPGQVVEKIAQAFRSLKSSRSVSTETELIRLASLVETLAEPLVEFGLTPLLVYVRGMVDLARGDEENATAQLATIAHAGKIQISGEELPIPNKIKANWGQPSQPTEADFRHERLRGRSFKGQDLTGANFSYTDLRGTNFIDATLVSADFSHAKIGMQRRWAIGLMFCCLLLAVFSGIGAALVGAVFGGLLTTMSQGVATSSASDEFNRAILNSLLRWSSLIVSATLAVLYITDYIKNHRQGWQALLKALTLALMLSPASLVISIFLTGYRLPSSYTDFVSSITGSVGSILFVILYFFTLHKSLGSRWIAVALALVGASYLAGVVLFALSVGWSSLVSQPLLLVLVSLGVVCLLFFLMTRTIVLKWRVRGILLAVSILSCLVGISLSLWLPSQDEVNAGIATSIACAIATTFLAVTLAWRGTCSKTLAGLFFNAGGFTFLLLVIATLVGWFVVQAPFTDLAWIILLTFTASIVVAVFLVLAGVVALRGAIIGIIIVAVAVTIFVGLAAASSGREGSLFSNLAASIAFLVLSLTSAALAWAIAMIVAVSIAIAWAESGNRVTALAWISALASIPVVFIVAAEIITKTPSFVVAGTIILALAVIQLGVYIGWQAISGSAQFAAIRNAALAIASMGGTNFWGADLTNANFTQATLKGANFKQAKLTHARWFRSKKLDRVYADNSYLQYPQSQRLLTTRIGQGQNFDHLDLHGINLRQSNLAGASFVSTNLREADLQQANLSGAGLVNTQLDGTNLAGAKLTGSYLQDCEFTPATKLEGIECQYIYTVSDGEIRFRPGEFAAFIRGLMSRTQS